MHQLTKRLAAAIAVLVTVPIAAEGLDTGDTSWIMTSTALVLFMTLPGLSLFYAGLVRSGNVLSVLMQCFTIACLVSILWLVVGYSLAFGDGNFICRRPRQGALRRRYRGCHVGHRFPNRLSPYSS